jgi:chromosome segregation ATPase
MIYFDYWLFWVGLAYPTKIFKAQVKLRFTSAFNIKKVSCESEKCDYKNCQNRHQIECKFFNLKKVCKHGSDCEFKHLKKKINSKEDSTDKRENALEEIIKGKDDEIKSLKKSIKERKEKKSKTNNEDLEKQIENLKKELKIKDDLADEYKICKERLKIDLTKMDNKLKSENDDNKNKLQAKEKEIQSFKKEIDKFKVDLSIKNEELEFSKVEIKKKDEAITILKESTKEVTNRDFDRIKFLYIKAKHELKENTDMLNKEIIALRLSKSKAEVTPNDNFCNFCEFK